MSTEVRQVGEFAQVQLNFPTEECVEPMREITFDYHNSQYRSMPIRWEPEITYANAKIFYNLEYFSTYAFAVATWCGDSVSALDATINTHIPRES